MQPRLRQLRLRNKRLPAGCSAEDREQGILKHDPRAHKLLNISARTTHRAREEAAAGTKETLPANRGRERILRDERIQGDKAHGSRPGAELNPGQLRRSPVESQTRVMVNYKISVYDKQG